MPTGTTTDMVAWRVHHHGEPADVLRQADIERPTPQARELGADEVVDRNATDVVAAVKELTGHAVVDVVYDPVGGDAFDASTKVIGFEGRIVVIGSAGGRIAQAATNHTLVKNDGVLGLHWGLYRRYAPQLVERAHDELCALVAEGRLDPLVSERVPFADVPDALAQLASGRSTGRIVVEVQDA